MATQKFTAVQFVEDIDVDAAKAASEALESPRIPPSYIDTTLSNAESAMGEWIRKNAPAGVRDLWGCIPSLRQYSDEARRYDGFVQHGTNQEAAANLLDAINAITALGAGRE